MTGETIEAFLDRLAARRATPGGGAVAALQVAHAAALVAMVARFSAHRHGAVAQQVGETVRHAEMLRSRGLSLAAEDERAFGAVAAALDLPRSSTEERAARKAALDSALLRASEPPARVAALAESVVGLAEPLASQVSLSTLADLAAAVEVARAAAATSGRNVLVNISGLEPSTVPNHLASAHDQAARTIEHADALLANLDGRLGD